MSGASKQEGTKRNPLLSYQFRLKFADDTSNNYIAGVRSVSGLSWKLSVVERWSGGNNLHPHVNPEKISWDMITLEQGLACDGLLEDWANAARDYHLHNYPSENKSKVKRLLQIDVWDPRAEPKSISIIESYLVSNAWVSKYDALPKLDAMSSEVAFRKIEVAHEGWAKQSNTQKKPEPRNGSQSQEIQ